MLLFSATPFSTTPIIPFDVHGGNVGFRTLPEGTPINVTSPTVLRINQQPYNLLPGKFVITNGVPVSAEGTKDKHFSGTKP